MESIPESLANIQNSWKEIRESPDAVDNEAEFESIICSNTRIMKELEIFGLKNTSPSLDVP